MGRFSALQWLFSDALRVMTEGQRDDLLRQVTALVAGLTDRWQRDRSDFQTDFLNELEHSQFVLAHFDTVRPSDESGPKELYILCRNCDMPAVPWNEERTICLHCKRDDTFEVLFL